MVFSSPSWDKCTFQVKHCNLQQLYPSGSLNTVSPISDHPTDSVCWMLLTNWIHRNSEKLFKILILKTYYMSDKFILSWTFLILCWEIFLHRTHIKRVICMLIISENFGGLCINVFSIIRSLMWSLPQRYCNSNLLWISHFNHSGSYNNEWQHNNLQEGDYVGGHSKVTLVLPSQSFYLWSLLG